MQPAKVNPVVMREAFVYKKGRGERMKPSCPEIAHSSRPDDLWHAKPRAAQAPDLHVSILYTVREVVNDNKAKALQVARWNIHSTL